jgi:hypothetical protein
MPDYRDNMITSLLAEKERLLYLVRKARPLLALALEDFSGKSDTAHDSELEELAELITEMDKEL